MTSGRTRKRNHANEGRPAAGAPPLRGVRVIDMSRLAPGPYCSMLLADLGAEVIVVGGGRSNLPVAALCRGKQFITLDLKSQAGQEALRHLAARADVLIEGFRPGVADRLGAGYDALAAVNPRLVYCSLTGYGQDGPEAQTAGHDINYLSMAGVLGAVGPTDGPPTMPLNLLADFGGGGLLAAFGIVTALYERERSGRGQYVDAAMVDGCISMMAMHFPDWGEPVLPRRGEGLVAGGAPFYRCYACADGHYVAVGALEPAFFRALWTTLGFGEPVPDHLIAADWPAMEQRFADAFRRRPRDQWVEVFRDTDACVTPVLTPDEVFSDAQVRSRHPDISKHRVPAVPRFSRTPGRIGATDLDDRTEAVLTEAGVPEETVRALRPGRRSAGVQGLVWPPDLAGQAAAPGE